MPQMTGKVTHNERAQQFELPVAGGLAVLRYKPSAGQIDLVHTAVPPEDEGRGHGTALVQAAFAHARRAGLLIVPTCPFVRAYLEKHPDQRDIVVDR